MRLKTVIVFSIFVLVGNAVWYWFSPWRLRHDLDEVCVIAQAIEAKHTEGEISAAEVAAMMKKEINSPLRDRRLGQIREEVAQNFGRPGVEMPDLLKIQSEIVAREGVPGWNCPVLFGL